MDSPRHKCSPWSCGVWVGSLCLLASWCATPLWGEKEESGAQTHVLMINGGGSPRLNYQSHLLHLRQLNELLLERGVQNSHITILSADGSDPGADLAVREVQAEREFWRLSGTRLERPLRNRIRYENSEISGATLRPATQASVLRWFRTKGSRLRRGDTLVLYVTDHGRKGKNGPSDNTITLWGKEEDLTVAELTELMAMLDPNVSVVALMSQCYSGAFANLMYGPGDDLPRGNICGFFSTTADRRAYGCYAENRDKDNVGHSFRFLQALGTAPGFDEAHSRVLVTDHSPDVPLKTSDLYLEAILRAEAGRLSEEFESLVDRLLHQAWQNKGAWEPEIRLLDRMGTAFGYFSPRFLSELDRQPETLSQVGQQFEAYSKAWKAAQRALNRENLRRFLLYNPHRDAQFDQAALAAGEAQPLAGELLVELADHTRNDTETAARMDLLREKAEATQKASYRMEVRQGVIVRMRFTLIGIAGRVHLARQAAASQRQAYEALVACEEFTLTRSQELPASSLDTEPFPSYKEELKLAEAALPGWMGIRFRAVSPDLRDTLSLQTGAVSVIGVYEDSAAQEAGLVQGDIILGPPGEPFTEAQRIREWVMTAPIGKPQTLVVRRDDERIQVSLTPRPYPRQMPELPGPPKEGSAAPLLDKLQSFRGTLPAEPTKGGPALLFFWATWCGPCKAALPEISAFEKARDMPVIAIADEPAEKLEAFFQKYQGPFPGLVATDEFRHSFVAYGVSGTPTFVLIDNEGKIESISKGYRKRDGLPVAGWSWAGPEKDSGED